MLSITHLALRTSSNLHAICNQAVTLRVWKLLYTCIQYTNHTFVSYTFSPRYSNLQVQQICYNNYHNNVYNGSYTNCMHWSEHKVTQSHSVVIAWSATVAAQSQRKKNIVCIHKKWILTEQTYWVKDSTYHSMQCNSTARITADSNNIILNQHFTVKQQLNVWISSSINLPTMTRTCLH